MLGFVYDLNDSVIFNSNETHPYGLYRDIHVAPRNTDINVAIQ